MRPLMLLLIVSFLFSCYGSDTGKVNMRIKIPLTVQQQVDDETGIFDDELSIDSYFAVADVLVSGEKSGVQKFSMVIRYAESKLGNYYFDTTIEAVSGETISISFGGYYKMDNSSVGGFVSDREYQIDVKEGMVSEAVIESVDLKLSEVSLKIKDQSVSSVIFFDPVREIYLMTIDKSPVASLFYMKVPEGRYDIYSTDRNKNRKLLRQAQEIKGDQVNLEI